MTQLRTRAPWRLSERACVCCGYRGPELQRDPARAGYRCPACGQDLYARPPRSYAELEGLIEPVAEMAIDDDAIDALGLRPRRSRGIRGLLGWLRGLLSRRRYRG